MRGGQIKDGLCRGAGSALSVTPQARQTHIHPLRQRQRIHAAQALQDWLTRAGITPIQVYPGSPWENGYNERFNGTLSREIFNAEWFSTIKQARTVIGKWLRQYNHVRPHQALNMKPPVPETLQASGP